MKSEAADSRSAPLLALLFWSLSVPWLGCNRAGVEQQGNIAVKTISHGPAVKETPGTPSTAKTSTRSTVSEVAREAAADPAPGIHPDGGERISLSLSRGRLVIELRVTIDGHPLRDPREELVAELVKLADRNNDGRATWGEVFADPKRIFGQSLRGPLKLSSRKEFFKANDTNRNGLVDRDEARRLVSQLKRSEAALIVESVAERPLSGARRSIVRKLLDADGDGQLEARELSALERRLLIRDANDDRIVSWSELDDTLAADELALAPRKTAYHGEPVARTLEPAADPRPGAAHIALALAFAEGDRAQLTLESTSPGAQLEGQASPMQVSVSFREAGCRLRFFGAEPVASQDRPPSRLSAIYAAVFEEEDAIFSLLDANHDHRLSAHELHLGASALEAVDADGDGRIVFDEVPESLVIVLGRGEPPERTSVRQTVMPTDEAQDAPSWFQHMDANSDHEISREEFPGSNEKFLSLDLDNDGYITVSEAEQSDSIARR